MNKKEILLHLSTYVVNLDMQGVMQVTKEALNLGIPPYKIIMDGMARGMDIVGKKYESKEYFLPELIMAGEVMKAGIQILEPHLKGEKVRFRGTVVIGTVKGDLHDIGKNIVSMLLTSAGFRVHDLGVDVHEDRFVRVVKETNADILALSALLTTTIPEMSVVVEALKKAKIRDRVKIIIGGAPANEKVAREIGADAFGRTAVNGLEICKKWTRKG